MIWLTAIMTLTQMADLLTAQSWREANPLALGLMGQPLLLFASKVALTALVCSIALIVDYNHRRLSRFLLAFSAGAGAVGAVSNIV